MVTGKVTDHVSGEPLPFATVGMTAPWIFNNGGGLDEEGRYVIWGVPYGIHEMRVKADGYLESKQTVRIDEETGNIDFAVEARTYGPYMETFYRRKLFELPPRRAFRTVASPRFRSGRGDYQGFPARKVGHPTFYYESLSTHKGPESLSTERKPYKNTTAADTAFSEATGPMPKQAQMRSDFADLAWWAPTLRTDAEGKAYFTVEFPDDLTKWKAWAVAMTDDRQQGKTTSALQAYKDLVATLRVPRFLLEGDGSTALAQSRNYLNQTFNVVTRFDRAGVELESSHHLKDYVTQRFPFSAFAEAAGDSLELSYALEVEEKLKDGETHKIPILPTGLERQSGAFHFVSRDTQLTIQPNPALGEVELIFFDSPISFALSEIKKLKDYPYGCMEQTASRLRALLAEKQICEATGKRFAHMGMVRKMMRRLEKSQLPPTPGPGRQ
ncbi:MAG: alpha-2-macroglobulin family protein, partial [Bacteroidota bacterium]